MATSKVYLSITAMAFTIIVVSCKKTSTSVNTDLTGASEYSLIEQISDDVTNMAGQVSEGVDNTFNGNFSVNLTYASSSAATVTHDTVHKTIVVNFLNIACPDGHVRNGTLTFNYSQSPVGANYFRNPGFTMAVFSSAYSDNGNAVTIHKTITNTTPAGFNPAATNLTWTVSDTIRVVEPGDSVITIVGSRIKTLLNTSDTTIYHGQAQPITWSLARMGIIGSSTGTNSEGVAYSATITTASYTSEHGLVRDFTCSPVGRFPADHPFILGAVTVNLPTEAINYLDYSHSNIGAGSCDKLYSILISSNLYYISTE